MPGDRLTIVHISTQRHWYGGEAQACLLACGLRARGHRCVVFARRHGAFAQRMRDEGFEVHTFLGNGRHPQGLWQLRRGLARVAPDIVHFHDAHAVTAGGLAILGLPVGGRVAARRCDYPLRWAAKYRRLCDRVVAVSGNVADVCVACGLPKSKVRIIYDGVDPARPRSGDRRRGEEALASHPDQTTLLTVASLNRSKGHIDLLEALPAVLDRHPAVRVAFAGDGKLRNDLKGAARRLGVDAAVEFLGYREDVPDLLQAADVFVMPSRIEPLGSSVVEAMLARVPIVSTTAGGIPELVGRLNGDSAVAFLAEPANPRRLAETILEALDDPGRREDLSQRAERRARKLFTADRMVDQTLQVYQELLG
ncbi:MAG: glycosyltransferase family 4 protein [Planctomycetota bacterium]|jgi:glycosyltransferase involved in cell wall biosynthesis